MGEESMMTLTMKNIKNIKPPPHILSDPNRNNDYEFALQCRVSLYSLNVGFFGRTYEGKEI
jgi:hypothetical protein